MAISEVAQLRLCIEEEYIAAQRALYDPAIVGKHEFITARMENMHVAHVGLQAIVGEDEAIKLVIETISNLPEGKYLEEENQQRQKKANSFSPH